MIIWGRKAVYRSLGYVADFCPICIGAKAFALQRIGMAGHIYYITAGDGDLVDYQRTCLTCGIELRADTARYATIAKKPNTISLLLNDTFPNFEQVYKDRLALEQRIRSDLSSLSAEDRRDLIMIPFTLISPKVTKRFSETHFSLGSSYIRNEIIPTLGATLHRLQPTELELKLTLARLVQLKEVIGSKVKLADLMADIKSRGPIAGYTPGTGFARSEAAQPPSQSAGGQTKLSGRALLPHHKAGRMIRLTAWLFAVLTVVMGLSMLIPMLSGSVPFVWSTLGGFALAGGLVAGLFMVGSAVMRRATWGRTGGIAYGLLLLIGFPIGTIIGAYLLWNLLFGWSEGEFNYA